MSISSSAGFFLADASCLAATGAPDSALWLAMAAVVLVLGGGAVLIVRGRGRAFTGLAAVVLAVTVTAGLGISPIAPAYAADECEPAVPTDPDVIAEPIITRYSGTTSEANSHITLPQFDAACGALSEVVLEVRYGFGAGRYTLVALSPSEEAATAVETLIWDDGPAGIMAGVADRNHSVSYPDLAAGTVINGTFGDPADDKAFPIVTPPTFVSVADFRLDATSSPQWSEFIGTGELAPLGYAQQTQVSVPDGFSQSTPSSAVVLADLFYVFVPEADYSADACSPEIVPDFTPARRILIED